MTRKKEVKEKPYEFAQTLLDSAKQYLDLYYKTGNKAFLQVAVNHLNPLRDKIAESYEAREYLGVNERKLRQISFGFIEVKGQLENILNIEL